MPLELFIILGLIFANGLFAMAEFAVMSVRQVKLQERAEAGDAAAQAALELAQDPGRFLSTVQIGITLVGTLAGAFGGATVAARLAPLIGEIDFLQPYSHAISITIVVVIITYLSLVIGELVPKRLALAYAEQMSRLVARPLRAMAKLAGPVVKLLSVSTDLVLRVLGVSQAQQANEVTEEEVKILLEHGTREGVFEPLEEEMVGRVFRLGDRSVSALITPRPEIVWLDVEDSLEELERKVKESSHSHFPVAKGDLDNLLGLVHSKDLLAQSLEQQSLDIKAILREPVFVPEGMPALDMLERFKETRSQIALVVDEYGSLHGLITPIDILEAIVGDIPEPHESIEPEIVQREDGSWLVDGRLSMDDVEELLQVHQWPQEGEQYYQTLGGFVMTKLGRMPVTGDEFEWENMRFEVVDMDGRRVDKVLITPRSLEPPTEAADDEG